METPNEAKLKAMKYSELKKFARDRGIKGSMKAEKLVATILAQSKAAEDSFLTIEQQVINSCVKNKVAKFDSDKATPSDTPRRETYTLESPSVDFENLNDDFMVSSASPVLKKTIDFETSLNVTLTRGSEKKSLKKRKVSFVTPVRRSSRLSAVTPHYASIKDRPKTPIPARGSSVTKNVSFQIVERTSERMPKEENTDKEASKTKGKKPNRPSTPMPSKLKKINLSSTSLEKTLSTSKFNDTSTIMESKEEKSESNGFRESKIDRNITNVVNSASKSGMKRKRSESSPGLVSKVKRTPNFKELHQKEFDKMESIEEYQKRKAASSAKKLKEHLKIHDPAKSSVSKKGVVKKNAVYKTFGGIPFIPSVTSTKNMKTNFAANAAASKPKSTMPAESKKTMIARRLQSAAPLAKTSKEVSAKPTKPASRENTPLQRRFKFDLQASLSRKLSYKPHKGPVKPLLENNSNSTLSNEPKTRNKLVAAKRAEARTILSGVRTNRRFQLQMSNRKAKV